jgi:hypothetical protein
MQTEPLRLEIDSVKSQQNQQSISSNYFSLAFLHVVIYYQRI